MSSLISWDSTKIQNIHIHYVEYKSCIQIPARVCLHTACVLIPIKTVCHLKRFHISKEEHFVRLLSGYLYPFVIWTVWYVSMHQIHTCTVLSVSTQSINYEFFLVEEWNIQPGNNYLTPWVPCKITFIFWASCCFYLLVSFQVLILLKDCRQNLANRLIGCELHHQYTDWFT